MFCSEPQQEDPLEAAAPAGSPVAATTAAAAAAADPEPKEPETADPEEYIPESPPFVPEPVPPAQPAPQEDNQRVRLLLPIRNRT